MIYDGRKTEKKRGTMQRLKEEGGGFKMMLNGE